MRGCWSLLADEECVALESKSEGTTGKAFRLKVGCNGEEVLLCQFCNGVSHLAGLLAWHTRVLKNVLALVSQ